MSRPVYLFLTLIILAVTLGVANRDEIQPKPATGGTLDYSVSPDSFASTSVTAASFIVFDMSTGRVFGERASEVSREMASITKLITAYTALATSTIDASTTVSWRAISTEGRAGHLTAGQKTYVRELLFPLLLESSNDAAEAIAEANGRTHFIALMNEQVRALGMASTTLLDPTGLSRGNVSTASDLMVLLQHLDEYNRHVLDITTLSSYVGNRQIWQNSDPLLSSEGFRGGKHGYTDTAGRTIALIVEEQFADIGAVRAIGIVLLDSDDLTGDVAKLREEFRRSVTLTR